MALNHIAIMGRLTKDPELRHTQSGKPVASFTVAVDRDFSRDGQRETDFVDVVAWNALGEFVSKYFRKGSMAVVSGRLQSRKWQDRDGNNRVSWEIKADSVYFGEKKSEGSNAASYSAEQYGQGQQDFTDLPDDDGELPF